MFNSMDSRAHTCAISTLDSLVWKGLHEHVKNKHKSCNFTRGSEPFFFPLNARASTGGDRAESQNTNLPPVLPKNKKKPYVVPPKRGGFLSKKGPKKPLEDCYSPPGNGLLVPELIPVAHAVYQARETLLRLAAQLMEVVPVKACKFCDHTHVGTIGHEICTCEGPRSDSRHARHVWTTGCVSDVVSNLDAYHCYDRFKMIKHDIRFEMKRIPALVELCIQAGVDLPDYPVLRRTDPVRVFGRKIVEADEFYFQLPPELDFSIAEEYRVNASSKAPRWSSNSLLGGGNFNMDNIDGEGISSNGIYQEMLACGDEGTIPSSPEEVKQVAETALRLWEVMRSGAEKLMKRYTVRACGYCPEVNIGPRGHMVRLCGAFKHQWRQGKHGWQVAGIDDLIPPKYVWHVPDLKSPLLLNEMRKFYGQAPAIVELCVQAGADAPSKYIPMMRLDVVAPTTYEAERAV